MSYNSYTVKIVYNDAGYDDQPHITTEFLQEVWFAIPLNTKYISYNYIVYNDKTCYYDGDFVVYVDSK